jgi:uncharacterized cupin superfamily protein
MKQVTIDELDSNHPGETDVHCLTDALGTEHLACNHYRIPPGKGLPAGLHAHRDQEEVFLVLEGTAVFETLSADQTTASEEQVESGDAIRFAPGEFQAGRNAGDDELLVLALGGPRDSEDVRLPAACPDCENDTVRLEVGEAGVTFVCPACGAEHTPADCPDCGGTLEMHLDENDQPVAVCGDCGATFAEPPLRE